MKTKIVISLLALVLTGGATGWANPFEVRMHQVMSPLKNEGMGNASPAVFPYEFRSIDGSGNNPIDSTRGAANTSLLRTTTNA